MKRVFRALTTLLGTTLIIFILVRVVPADPAVSIAGPKADPETLAAIRKDLGLDDPLPVQYGRYVAGLAHGDLGRSYMTGRRVADVIAERVPATALLAAVSLSLGFLAGLVVGIATAARRGSAIDVAVLVVTLLGLAIAALMSGVVLTETVFTWPGLGRLAVQAVFDLDIPLVAGTVLFSAVLVLVANLAVDLLYGVIDPRVRHG